MNNKTDIILKSQRVARRKNAYSFQGNAALKGIDQIHQNPVHKKRIPPPKTAEENNEYTEAEESLLPPYYAPAAAPVVKKTIFTPQFMILSICFVVLGFFAYYALLWQDNEIQINPEAEAFTRRKMMAYALGSSGEHLPLPEKLPLSVTETFSWSNYTVRKGDSVSKIAADNGLSLDAVIASNNLYNARLLREGEALRIPNMDGIPYTVVKGDSYQKIADKMNVALEAILDANDIQNDDINVGDVLFLPGAKMRSDDLKMALGELFVYPVRGRLSSSFGWRKDPFTGQRRYHSAIDLAANTGTPIRAAADGRVTSVAYSPVFGNYLIITHSGNFQSMYAHLNSISVKEGDRVEQNSNVGAVGNTGRSTGAHLHFAIYKNGRAVNPLEYIKY
ncbi:MAG: M23 family metallopeptidase [Spirochaetaceae bacterium]|jgi:murein DD-endopeptidase MepM/ murein hydrolase activator NlpD|nr:M23 family metallopeptidase [Spirochaetaceae bacterium]